MDDPMRMLTEERRGAALARPDELAPAWDRLVAEMSAAPVNPTAVPSRPADRSRPNLGRSRSRIRGPWTLAVVGVAAALIVTAVVVAVPQLIGGSVPAAQAEATAILNSAAEAALAAPFVEPRPDQFLYTRIVFPGGQEEIWSSIDGTHDGLSVSGGGQSVTPGCRDGKRAAYHGDQYIGQEDCAPEPVYRPDLPTDTDAMYDYLLAQAGTTDPASRANWLGKFIFGLAADYLRPGARAALFRAAGRLPGITVIRDAVDDQGRHGVGIAWTMSGDASLFVFDPVTFTRMDRESALVDQVGQRP